MMETCGICKTLKANAKETVVQLSRSFFELRQRYYFLYYHQQNEIQEFTKISSIHCVFKNQEPCAVNKV